MQKSKEVHDEECAPLYELPDKNHLINIFSCMFTEKYELEKYAGGFLFLKIFPTS